MATYIDQYTLETTWSTSAADSIVMESINSDIPLQMEMDIVGALKAQNTPEDMIDTLFTKLFSLVLKDRGGKPIQAIATQLGHAAGMFDSLDAFEWGHMFLLNCKECGLYSLDKLDNEWYVVPNFVLDKKTRKEVEKLQFLPPMKIKPNDWTTNHDGGWMKDTKHIVLGSKFSKHEQPVSYDVLNKLQGIKWEIDAQTYVYEKNTNRNMNKKKFLRVIDEYLGQPFHFVWRYDSRGRSYSSGYDLNLQSNEYGKALLSLHDKEKITNLDNLYIAIAGHAGQDKLTWDERIKWVTDRSVAQIEEEWKEPMLGRKAMRAFSDTIKNKKSGYVMNIDATSSGIQIMAALSGCHKTAKFVNMMDPATRYDLYEEVDNMMSGNLPKPAGRKTIKQCTMTHYYNSKSTPKALLSEDELACFYGTLDGLLPGAESVMDTINECWDDTATHHSWVMPDNHHVYVPVVVSMSTDYASAELGDIPLRYYAQMSSDNYRSLCPNIIHSIDAYIAREMIRRANFNLSHIHDCFVFSPDHLQSVCALYRVIMAEIAASDLLQDILRQVTGDSSLVLNKLSNDLDQYILNSSFMLS